MNSPASFESDFKHANLSLPEAYEVTWEAAYMALANTSPEPGELNDLLSERIGYLFDEIAIARAEADAAAKAISRTKPDDVKINLGSLLLKTEELAKSRHGEPEVHEGSNSFQIDDEGYLATQAIESYLKAAYREFKMRKFGPEFKPF
jgi:hypothetical protein